MAEASERSGPTGEAALRDTRPRGRSGSPLSTRRRPTRLRAARIVTKPQRSTRPLGNFFSFPRLGKRLANLPTLANSPCRTSARPPPPPPPPCPGRSVAECCGRGKPRRPKPKLAFRVGEFARTEFACAELGRSVGGGTKAVGEFANARRPRPRSVHRPRPTDRPTCPPTWYAQNRRTQTRSSRFGRRSLPARNLPTCRDRPTDTHTHTHTHTFRALANLPTLVNSPTQRKNFSGRPRSVSWRRPRAHRHSPPRKSARAHTHTHTHTPARWPPSLLPPHRATKNRPMPSRRSRPRSWWRRCWP